MSTPRYLTPKRALGHFAEVCLLVLLGFMAGVAVCAEAGFGLCAGLGAG